MKTFLVSLAVLACAVTCQGQNITKVTTVVVPGTVTNEFGGLSCSRVTNTIAIANGEAARVSTIRRPGSLAVDFTKDGFRWSAIKGDVVAGPAVFEIFSEPCEPALLTLERWKVVKSR